MLRRFTAALGLVVLGAVASACPPKPPNPPQPTVQTITISPTPAASGCAYTVTSTDAKNPYAATQATSIFNQVPWAVQSVTGGAVCPGFLPALSPSVGTAGDGKTTITLTLTPQVPPLPPVPTRATLANIHACFQGVIATSSDLGTVPSWGPDAWMHPKAEDRLATYNAHKAAGCNFITVALGNGGYQEAGVAYPDNKASGNWFDEKDFTSLCTATAEIIRNGQFPLMAVGGDNDGPTFDWVHQQFPANFAALKACKDGDLTPYIAYLLGFDSVDELATDDGANIDDLINFVRSVIGPTNVLVKENQSGWAFWSGAGGGGAGSYNSPAGLNVDVVLQEFDAPPGPPGPPPAVTQGLWDPSHSGYAAVFADPVLGSSFQRIWQVAGRTVHQWVNPPDEPLNVIVPCKGGGPSDGKPCAVGADNPHPPCYTCANTPRGYRYIIGYEYFTYLWVRMKASVSDVQGAGLYLTNAGYDQSAGPTSTTASASTFSVTAGGGARQTFTVRARTADDTQPHHMVMHKGGALPKKPATNHIGGGR